MRPVEQIAQSLAQEVNTMALPSAVRKQGEESDNAIQQAMKEAEARQAEEENNGGDPAKPAAATTDNESGDQPITPSNAVNQQIESFKKAAEDWKTRFTNYKASTDITIHDLREEISGLNQKVEQMTADLQAQPVKSEPVSSSDVLSESEKEDYSDEFVGMVGKVAMANAEKVMSNQSNMIQTLQKQVDELLGTVKTNSENVQKTESDRFFDDLDEAIPSWEALQADVRFDEYMSKTDPLSGFERGALLKKSFDDKNVNQSILLYTAFAKEHGLPTSLPTSNANPLEVVPDASGAGDGGGNQDETIYTQTEIDNFYHKWAVDKKSLNMTDEQLVAKEKQYIAAITEGRVRG